MSDTTVPIWLLPCALSAALSLAACGSRSSLRVQQQGDGAAGAGSSGASGGGSQPGGAAGSGGATSVGGAPGCDRAPTMLHAGETGVYHLTSDETHVYWCNDYNGAVMKMPLCGGDVTVLAEGESRAFVPAVDAQHVYWVRDGFFGALMRTEIGGGAPETVMSWRPGQTEWVRVDESYAYVTVVVDMDGQMVGIWRVEKDGSGAERIFAGDVGRSLAIDDDSVYFSTQDPGGGAGLMRMPKAGGTPSSLAPAADTLLVLGEIAVDEKDVYWTTWGSGDNVLRVPKAGGPVEVLRSGEPGAVAGLALDEAHVYWTSMGDGAVHARSKTADDVVTLATSQDQVEDIEARKGLVFWVNFGDGSLWRAGAPF